MIQVVSQPVASSLYEAGHQPAEECSGKLGPDGVEKMAGHLNYVLQTSFA